MWHACTRARAPALHALAAAAVLRRRRVRRAEMESPPRSLHLTAQRMADSELNPPPTRRTSPTVWSALPHILFSLPLPPGHPLRPLATLSTLAPILHVHNHPLNPAHRLVSLLVLGSSSNDTAIQCLAPQVEQRGDQLLSPPHLPKGQRDRRS